MRQMTALTIRGVAMRMVRLRTIFSREEQSVTGANDASNSVESLGLARAAPLTRFPEEDDVCTQGQTDSSLLSHQIHAFKEFVLKYYLANSPRLADSQIRIAQPPLVTSLPSAQDA